MRKLLLTYCSFVIACMVVIVAFIAATTYTQLAGAILLYPVLVFFAFKVLLPLQELSPLPAKPTEKTDSEPAKLKREGLGIADIDKRVFLKLIGGAGLALFLFSIFNKKGESQFFGKAAGGSGTVTLADTAGKKIDPAQGQPTDGYRISDIENGDITFYGFISKDSSWYIMRVDTGTSAFRYAKDKSNFRAGWSNRANLKYDYFDNVF